MLNTIKRFIDEQNMIKKGDRIVAGISGGADSVCLFYVLLELKEAYAMDFLVVHVNHGIRGQEAAEDEEYVSILCKQYGIPFFSFYFDVPSVSVKNGMSEEEAGRWVRYQAFNECLKKNKCNKIAIAHNKNDNAETILFHLFRGSGITGLTGIKPVREEIIRPLLCVGRAEIEEFLRVREVSFRDDKTNLMENYSRNKIRHRVLKYAAENINPKAVEHIVNAGNQLKEIEQYLDRMIFSAFSRIVVAREGNEYEVDIEKFIEEEPVIQKGVLRLGVQQLAGGLKDIDAFHIDLIMGLMTKEVSKRLNLPYGILAVREYNCVVLKKQNQNSEESHFFKNHETEIIVPGEQFITGMNLAISTKLINYKKNMIIPKNGCTKWFDYDKIKNTVLIRTRKTGDYLQIDAKGSRKKLKSLFIDEKIPREKRELLPLLADGPHIMWIIGGRMSEAYKVDEETKVILEIHLDGGKDDES
ncbi:tRNA(Ile)-lysidine synthase [Anaerocolumna cellulosilytica]|uniref:tRNA(Ile)-lysidine synthase n=1 Tax=Anaerocolumna cellulosilytica TaxID=433286 RepID=A0A6S6QPZ8_9FIRM|nr:tRNA lysidine(34) synthetase TilS [Anaerocolumna cellulosilytica]MBB5196957.1 tRNA(Ile)-lysidine synthase [Anaerocolumna cellulosilytica]BCJ92644.1 tRNA(Ile)-lysidine synthase [Anaerocolumna cellulosilytica]